MHLCRPRTTGSAPDPHPSDPPSSRTVQHRGPTGVAGTGQLVSGDQSERQCPTAGRAQVEGLRLARLRGTSLSLCHRDLTWIWPPDRIGRFAHCVPRLCTPPTAKGRATPGQEDLSRSGRLTRSLTGRELAGPGNRCLSHSPGRTPCRADYQVAERTVVEEDRRRELVSRHAGRMPMSGVAPCLRGGASSFTPRQLAGRGNGILDPAPVAAADDAGPAEHKRR